MDVCIHGIGRVSCFYCNGFRLAAYSVNLRPVSDSEPPGHRGRPFPDEVARAARLQPRLIHALGLLAAADVPHPIAFFTDIVRLTTQERHLETWKGSPRVTIDALIRGRAARHWSMDAIEAAIEEVQYLTREEIDNERIEL